MKPHWILLEGPQEEAVVSGEEVTDAHWTPHLLFDRQFYKTGIHVHG